MLHRPRRPVLDVMAIVVHGAAGNYLGGVPRRLAMELARSGIPALAINTRLANFGVIYGGGLFTHAVADLDAALTEARALGASRIALVGYGVGASLVALHHAERRAPEVCALIHVAHPGNPGDAQRERWDRLGATPTWRATHASARRRLRDDAPDDIFVVERASGPSSAPGDAEIWTWRTWWDGRGSQAGHLDGPSLASRAGVPQLVVQPSTPLARSAGDAIVAATRDGGGPVTELRVLPSTDAALWHRTSDVAGLVRDFLGGLAPDGPAPAPAEEGAARARVTTLRALDGERHDALLVEDQDATERRARATGRRTAIVHLHGNQGNFSVGSLRYLPRPLAALGTPVLAHETRLANASQIFGAALFEDALRDIEAAVGWLAGAGFDHVVLSGYSLGAVLAARATAESWSLPLRGAALIGAARSLPGATRARMARERSRPSYDEVVARCRKAMARGREETLVIRRLYGDSPEPRLAGVYTTSTWWHSRGPEAHDAMPERHVPLARCPLLIVQGTEDTIVDPDDASALAGAARAGGCHDVAVAWIEGADHLMHDHADDLVAAVCAWVERHA